MRQIDVGGHERPGRIDAGPAPMLQWIRIEHLVVDDGYQRELAPANWKAIERIAREFKWSRFSPVFVAPIEGGRFAIIDGQHRTHAAAICGMAEVPCQVVQMSREEQAASFAAVNGLVTKVTLWQIYKAALAAGQGWAVECDRICADADCKLMTGNQSTAAKKAGEIYALGLIRGYRERGKGALVTAALKALRKSETGSEAAAFANELLRPWLDAVTERPWLAAEPARLAAFVDEFDIYAAIDRAAENAKRKRRLGFVVSHFALVSIEIGEGLDAAFPRPARAA